MDKSLADKQSDITAEHYEGPGAVIASAGYMYVSHGIAAVLGFFALGAVGYAASNKTVALKEAFKSFGERHADSPNILKNSTAWVARSIPRAANFVAKKVTAGTYRIFGERFADKSISEEAATATMFAGGIGAAAGWIGSSIWGILKGSHEGHKGKHQFERAKREITELREKNDTLESESHQLKKQLKAKEIARDLRISEDNPNVEPPQIPSRENLHQAQHEGMLAQERTAAPELS